MSGAGPSGARSDSSSVQSRSVPLVLANHTNMDREKRLAHRDFVNDLLAELKMPGRLYVTGSLAFYFDKSEQPPIDDQDDNEDHANSYMEPDDVHHGC